MDVVDLNSSSYNRYTALVPPPFTPAAPVAAVAVMKMSKKKYPVKRKNYNTIRNH